MLISNMLTNVKSKYVQENHIIEENPLKEVLEFIIACFCVFDDSSFRVQRRRSKAFDGILVLYQHCISVSLYIVRAAVYHRRIGDHKVSAAYIGHKCMLWALLPVFFYRLFLQLRT